AMKLGRLSMATCVSPAYIQRHGLPRTPEDLHEHLVVHYAQSLDEGAPSLELVVGDLIVDHPMRHLLAVNGIDAYRAAGLSGFGLIQVPRYSIVEELASGALIEVLAEYPAPPLPVAIVHTYG
ncbi:MAG TPA: LysR substrate-binding domain-containing protein, partial [Myxococcota bacterium]|nr:LysR substrate-binding domain-containing protein [Myxococcota bacterium]